MVKNAKIHSTSTVISYSYDVPVNEKYKQIN